MQLLLILLVCWCAAAVPAGSDDGRGLIVRFSTYAPASAHAATLAACVRATRWPHAHTQPGSHGVIERDNPAARLPTDFLLVDFPQADALRLAGAVRVRACSVLCCAALLFLGQCLIAGLVMWCGRAEAPERTRRAYPAALCTSGHTV